MNPKNDAAELFRQGVINDEQYYALEVQRVHALNVAAKCYPRAYPPTICAGKYYDAGDAYLYSARGRYPGAPALKE